MSSIYPLCPPYCSNRMQDVVVVRNRVPLFGSLTTSLSVYLAIIVSERHVSAVCPGKWDCGHLISFIYGKTNLGGEHTVSMNFRCEDPKAASETLLIALWLPVWIAATLNAEDRSYCIAISKRKGTPNEEDAYQLVSQPDVTSLESTSFTRIASESSGKRCWCNAMVGTSSMADWPGWTFVSDSAKNPVCGSTDERSAPMHAETKTYLCQLRQIPDREGIPW